MRAVLHGTSEEIANSGSHAVALVGAALATPTLLESALHRGTRAYAGVAVFAFTMMLLYGASTAYHALPPGKAKQWFLKLDHAAIYLFIAGSYTPFALSQPASEPVYDLFGDRIGVQSGGVDATDAPHGLVPMQAAGASNHPISLQPCGQVPCRAVCGVAALANSTGYWPHTAPCIPSRQGTCATPKRS